MVLRGLASSREACDVRVMRLDPTDMERIGAMIGDPKVALVLFKPRVDIMNTRFIDLLDGQPNVRLVSPKAGGHSCSPPSISDDSAVDRVAPL